MFTGVWAIEISLIRMPEFPFIKNLSATMQHSGKSDYFI